MIIREYFYCENNEVLTVEFSTKEDGDDFYRILELEYYDIEYYYPDIFDEKKLKKLDKDDIKDIVEGYLSENELPEQLTL